MPRVTGYLDRNNILAGMGFTTYAAYLASDLWAGIKSRVLTPGETRCVLCQRRATVVHHYVYTAENMSGISLAGLHPLCFPCHTTVEHGKGGVKLSLPDAQAKFNRMYAHRVKTPAEKAKRSERIRGNIRAKIAAAKLRRERKKAAKK